MLYEKIDLYDYFGKERKDAAGYLTVYVRERCGELSPKIRPAMLIIPGGAYQAVSTREAEPVAISYLSAGYAAFVLEYTVNAAYPLPLIEAAMAVVYIRENAAKYGLSPEHIGVTGFSAGGHLAGMLCTMYDDPALKEWFSAARGRIRLARPSAGVLCYPVITEIPKYTSETTIETIAGGSRSLRRKLSLETRVSSGSVPVFLWHTQQDEIVAVQNSVLLANAYLAQGIPFELHVFEKGGHGASIAGIETENSAEAAAAVEHLSPWFPLALSWLRLRGFTVAFPPTDSVRG